MFNYKGLFINKVGGGSQKMTDDNDTIFKGGSYLIYWLKPTERMNLIINP